MILPTLLAGPILRRVEPTSVTVWVAFSKKQTTKLVIWDNGGEGGDQATAKEIKNEKVQSEPVETIEVAAMLHIALITVNTSQKRLVEKKAYSYNIYFGDSADTLKNNDLGTSKLLHEPPGSDPEKFVHLGYTKGSLPTIVLPCDKPEDLHIVHGSCRKIHGGGDDAFRHVDTLIKSTKDTPESRPQQLYLTGDQIYADEVPHLALPFINTLGSRLFADKKEQLIIKATSAEIIKFPADMEHFPPNCRQFLVNETAKFTGNGVPSHLLSFQEYCSTYLHYWSPDVWHPELKLMLNKYKEKDYDEVAGSFHYYYLLNLIKNFDVKSMAKLLFKTVTEEQLTALLTKLKGGPGELSDDQKSNINKTLQIWTELYNTGDIKIADFENIAKLLPVVASMTETALEPFFKKGSVMSESKSSCDFLEVLPLARRALANIPCYMIFDDHEITDDWNFSQFWKNRVYTSSLGVQGVRNGMMAYTLFQDLGNVPAEYPNELFNPPSGLTDLEKKKDAYRDSFGKTKGNKLELLKKITDYGKAISAGSSPEAPADLSNSIDQLLFVGASAADDKFVVPVRWHYDIPCGTAHTFFLDTRTRREYDEFTGPPGLLPKAALDDQLPERIAELNYPVVFVISPVPALGLPVIEEFAQPLVGSIESQAKKDEGVGGAPPGALSAALKRDNEAWGFSEKHFEQFLERLALFKKVVILSGDVHFGYSAYADYWKERKEANHSRIIQLVSSSFKNGWDLDFVTLKSGFAQRLLGAFDFEFEKHGWKDKTLKIKGNMAPRHRMRLRRNPVVLPRQGWYEGTTIVDPLESDWVWRLKLAVDETEYKNLDAFPHLPLKIDADLIKETVAGKGKEVEKTFFQMADRHNSLFKLGRDRRIMWQPHIGHIFFSKAVDDAHRLVLNHEFNYTCRSDGFLNSDISPDPASDGVSSGAFTLHAINIDVTAEEKKPPKKLDEKLEPNPVV